MKTKKLVLPILILSIAVLAMAAYTIVGNIAKKPTVTEQDFAFSITYELDGKPFTIDDIYTVRYDRNGGYNDTKSRIYIGKIGGKQEEDDTGYILRQDADGRIELDTRFYPDYMMGDAWYDYFVDKAFEPALYYYDAEETEYTDEETLLSLGVKLVDFEYPEPIENSFVFSHISRVNGEVVIPTVLIGAAALLMMLLVKREKELVSERVEIHSAIVMATKEQGSARSKADTACAVCNILIGVIVVPFLMLVESFFDIAGGNEAVSHQMMCFTPALTVLCIAASIGLRRKGFAKSAFVVPFIGLVVWGLLLLINTIGLF